LPLHHNLADLLANNGRFTPPNRRHSERPATQTMKNDHKRVQPGTETELKLALPGNDPAELLRRLSSTAVLKRRKPVQQRLYSIYFDTPDQFLARHQAALRVRRVEQVGEPHWVQTLKTGKRRHSALSRRGEWEAPVAGPALDCGALDAAAWARLDPDGTVQAALEPCFETDFNRTIWMVRRRDGSAVEVALDIGHATSGDNTTAICELELELKAGPVSALFDIALQIAAAVPVLPLAMSKAQRGYALATGSVDAPVPANPPRLRASASLHDATRSVLREMFGQFTANLAAMRDTDDPEIVHQSRVAWRRFKSARRLFKPVLAAMATPDWKALGPLLAFLGELRDLDVAHTETLPPLRDAYVAQDTERASTWNAMLSSLAQARGMQRTAVRYALEKPTVGRCLLQTTQWLELPPLAPDRTGDQPALRRWADRRTRRLHERLKLASKQASDAQSLHKVRLLAKRTRYSIDALRGVLPQHTVRKWYRQAMDMQKGIGAERDLDQAISLLKHNDTPADLVAFLRGVAAGRRRQ
jgi:inorganic triphosphatase YgiF